MASQPHNNGPPEEEASQFRAELRRALINAGVLGKVRAELRTATMALLRDETSAVLQRPPREFSAEEVTGLHIVLRFLESLQLANTVTVLQDEVGKDVLGRPGVMNASRPPSLLDLLALAQNASDHGPATAAPKKATTSAPPNTQAVGHAGAARVATGVSRNTGGGATADPSRDYSDHSANSSLHSDDLTGLHIVH